MREERGDGLEERRARREERRGEIWRSGRRGIQRIDGFVRWPGLTSHSTAPGTSRSCGCGSLLRISSSLARISPLLDILPRAAATAARFAAGASEAPRPEPHCLGAPGGAGGRAPRLARSSTVWH